MTDEEVADEGGIVDIGEESDFDEELGLDDTFGEEDPLDIQFGGQAEVE